MTKRRKPNGQQQESSNPYLYDASLLRKLDEHQKEYVKSIRKFPVTFSDSESGTGKTTLAVLMGFEALAKGQCQRIIYLRFPDDRYLKQGFYPGNDEEKAAKLYIPFFDALEEIGITESQFKTLKESGQILLTTDSTLRGCNLKHAFLIGDELQNAKEPGDLQLVLTRLHDEGGRAVMIGHSKQMDNRKGVMRTPKYGFIPFEAYAIHMLYEDFTNQVNLKINYRGRISQHADKIMDTWNEL